MERDLLFTFPHFSLFPSSLSISYIKIVIFCRKMLNTALFLQMSQKHNIRTEKQNLRETSLKNSRKLMQNMRLRPSGKASSANDICCSFSIWLRRQPTNQPTRARVAQNFYRISPASCIPPNHSWFSTIIRLVSRSCKFNKSTWKLLFTSLPPKPAKTKFIGPRSPIIIVHSLTN